MEELALLEVLGHAFSPAEAQIAPKKSSPDLSISSRRSILHQEGTGIGIGSCGGCLRHVKMPDSEAPRNASRCTPGNLYAYRHHLSHRVHVAYGTSHVSACTLTDVEPREPHGRTRAYEHSSRGRTKGY